MNLNDTVRLKNDGRTGVLADMSIVPGEPLVALHVRLDNGETVFVTALDVEKA